ncbi:MAG: glycosyltransferase, partial [Desulfovibrionales bacterium]|nr:glycosyltransferase [Desulfovibrionales bacterium]
MRPRIFISLAAPSLGGPGKGLLQFLEAGGFDLCDPVLAAFIIGSNSDSEYARVMRSAGAKVVKLNQRSRFDFSLVAQAEDVVIREKCQILQSHGYKSHVLCSLLSMRLRLPWIAFVHGWTAEDFRIHCYRLLEMGLVTLASRVVPVSKALGERLPLLAKRKMRIIPNAVAPQELERITGRNVRAELGIHDRALVAGVVGRLSPEKGQIHFLRALAQAHLECPDVVGMLIGDGQDRDILEAEARRLGLGAGIIFAGHTPCIGD